jgi:type III pantothenate kinase
LYSFTLDIGNTRSKLGCFSSAGELVSTKEFETGAWDEITAHLTNLGVGNIIYSSVANEPSAEWIADRQSENRQVWALSSESPLPFESLYQTMDTIGKDRLAALAGALVLYPGEHCLVIDAGTCITTDLLTADSVYHGGNISPGLRMRLKAMHQQTERLPLVEPDVLPSDLGLTTETALRIGGQGGGVYELEGLYHRLAAKWIPLNVVLTGGDAVLLAQHTLLPHNLQPNLVHYGLHKIMTLYADITV